MSDAMTNREIEDVLTSIRRLVAQEGGRSAESGRLVLTEAQRVPSAAPVPLRPFPLAANTPAGLVTGAPTAEDLIGPEPGQSAEAPQGSETGAEVGASALTLPAPDFGRLEATIAELEAAVTASGGGWDGDSSEESPKASNVTELYGRLSFAHRPPVAGEGEVGAPMDGAQMAGSEAPASYPGTGDHAAAASAGGAVASAEAGIAPVTAPVTAPPPSAPASAPAESAVAPDLGADPEAEAAPGPMIAQAPAGSVVHERVSGLDADPDAETPDVADEALVCPGTTAAATRADELAGTDLSEGDDDDIEALLDEEGLRALIAQIVREELQGQLGERITLQVRKLVRAEIARALDERAFL